MEREKKKRLTPLRGVLLAALALCLCFSLLVTLQEQGVIRWGLPSWRQTGAFFGVRENDAAELDVTVEVFDVGAADCILISAGDVHILIDAGNASDSVKLAQTLLRRGIYKLDLAIATHPHGDHIGGLAGTLALVPAQCVWMPESGPETAPDAAYPKLLELLKAQETPVLKPEAGHCQSFGGLEITVLHCGGESDNLNNLSLVALVVYQDISFLFMGDSEKTVEDQLVESGLLSPVTVLKAGHHGSATSTGEAFLDAVRPQFAALSCGSKAPPGEAVLQRLRARGVSYQRTDLDGTLIYTTDGKALQIYTQKEGE